MPDLMIVRAVPPDSPQGTRSWHPSFLGTEDKRRRWIPDQVRDDVEGSASCAAPPRALHPFAPSRLRVNQTASAAGAARGGFAAGNRRNLPFRRKRRIGARATVACDGYLLLRSVFPSLYA